MTKLQTTIKNRIKNDENVFNGEKLTKDELDNCVYVEFWFDDYGMMTPIKTKYIHYNFEK